MGELLKNMKESMKIDTMNAFVNRRRQVHNEENAPCFVRGIGCNTSYLTDILEMDKTLTQDMNAGKGYYCRLNGLKKLQDVEDVRFYSACYEKWLESGKTEVKIHTTVKQTEMAKLLGSACAAIEKVYNQQFTQISESMVKNLLVKMLFWLDVVLGNEKFVFDKTKAAKIVAANIHNKQEYLFFYLLTLMGCDVLLLQSTKDIGIEEEKLNLSVKFVLGDFREITIPQYNYVLSDTQKEESQMMTHVSDNGQERKIKVHIPERKRSNSKVAATMAVESGTKRSAQSINAAEQKECPEKSFEELARLAASVVLITIHDEKGEVLGGGSGIMVGKDGYILTNCHVASEGSSYSVRIEEDENVYQTDELIKYNQHLDLAIIRIDRKLKPLPIYNGRKPLVRGQKVVAIGSPLGFFNSVSDGIISGFRHFEDVDMMQFTAPTSYGSSGGAVLNMQGEVIGISTAGVYGGQNMNLAMGYECINLFVKGFV